MRKRGQPFIIDISTITFRAFLFIGSFVVLTLASFANPNPPRDINIKCLTPFLFPRLYCSTVRRYGLRQEYIAPYTPEQNGLCERFIRTLKEQCVWLHRFSSLQHARTVIGNWINQYNSIRPHQALDYLSPAKYLNSLLCKQAA